MAKRDKNKPPADYPVGYGKPPRHTRFKKGESGNPKGRPKGTLNISTVVSREARKEVIVNENGRRIVMTKLEVAAMQVINKAASGDLKAFQQVSDVLREAEEQAREGTAPNAALSDVDQKVVLGWLKRSKRLKGEPDK